MRSGFSESGFLGSPGLDDLRFSGLMRLKNRLNGLFATGRIAPREADCFGAGSVVAGWGSRRIAGAGTRVAGALRS